MKKEESIIPILEPMYLEEAKSENNAGERKVNRKQKAKNRKHRKEVKKQKAKMRKC